MGVIREVLVPQMGEGLQEVRIVSLQKRPGDPVKRDELIYSMETDKAVMEVESPFEGTLMEWLVEEDEVLQIGALVARIDTADQAEEARSSQAAPVSASTPIAITSERSAKSAEKPGEIQVSPRTRAYCREKGLAEAEILAIPSASSKLMPSDVDAYLAGREQLSPDNTDSVSVPDFQDRPVSRRQRAFIYRLKRSLQVSVPAVAKRTMPWNGVRRVAESRRTQQAAVQPSSFLTFAYGVVQAVKAHPRFRSAMLGDDTIREYAHLNLGIAVGTPEGQLNVAVVHGADSLDFDSFVTSAQERIQRARDGEDQADETTQVLLTYMGPYEITDGIPVLVPPAVAILFIGATFGQNGEPTVNLVLTFEHRLIQGIEAANFLKTIVEKVGEAVETLG